MAELISLCGRDDMDNTYAATGLETVADRILPENAPWDVEVVRDDGVLTCRINAPESLPTQETSTCLEQLIPRADDWHEPSAPIFSGVVGSSERTRVRSGLARLDQSIVDNIYSPTLSRNYTL